ncbi:hypothetical protein ACFV2S_28135 [Streptomyces sp. NPDC059695]|uniref:hypothetical protein n=1 Tax=Streptomyces sp. NPDC059695 TaxID=3346910 RepID=UPI0036BC0290
MPPTGQRRPIPTQWRAVRRLRGTGRPPATIRRGPTPERPTTPGRRSAARPNASPPCGGERTFPLFPPASAKDLVGPLPTLTVLLLAFVLVTANGSYGRSRIQADAVCYARAVRTQEWPAMADGEGPGRDHRPPDPTLRIVRDVDRPFDGLIDVEPTAMAEAEPQATRDFLAHSTVAELPCDDLGNRTAV